ncbi:MAG: HEAT repeat domain-containing protein [Actinobacteria bacterium]|nr:HEAT repeat domain-containing protein [Actinomycetota bacterium]
MGDHGKRADGLTRLGLALGRRLLLAWAERRRGYGEKETRDLLPRRGMPEYGSTGTLPDVDVPGARPGSGGAGHAPPGAEAAGEGRATEAAPASRSLEELMEALRDRSARVRKEAAKELGKRGGPGVEKALEPLLDDEEHAVREEAVAALRAIGGVHAARILKEALKSGDWERRKAVARALHELGWKEDQGEASALYHVAMGEWEQAARMGRRAVPALVSALQSSGDESLREGAAAALGRVGDQAAVQALIDALRDIHPRVRKAAARSLGGMGRRKAVEPLIEALEDPDEEVRREVVEALVRIGSAAMQPLVAALKEGSVTLRMRAAEVISRFYQSREMEPLVNAFLVSLLKEGDVWARARTATILGEIGEPWAVGPLIEALYFFNVREAARKALVRIGEPAVAPLIAALRHHHIAVRKAAADVLREIGDERAVNPLLSALKDRDWEVREAARAALAAIERRGRGKEGITDQLIL